MTTNPHALAQSLPLARRRRALVLCLALCLAFCTFGLSFSATADEPAFITFDPPDSMQTFPQSINAEGEIAGYYLDATQTEHGFLRGPGGRFTVFDAPGAATGLYQGTQGISINSEGAITGTYIPHCISPQGCNIAPHGFLRARDGTISEFDPPGSIWTTVTSINSEGEIVGYYSAGFCPSPRCPPTYHAWHGFVRARDSTITTIDPPGSVGTYPRSINPHGVIAGAYCDAVTCHGFLRARDGAITTFDPPGFIAWYSAININPEGAITGAYSDASVNVHGFLRARDGAITTFDPPGSRGTYPNSINSEGAITGTNYDQNAAYHGFLREPDGRIIDFEVPGAETGGINQGTAAQGINAEGTIAGYYSAYTVGTNFMWHGFVRRPHEDFDRDRDERRPNKDSDSDREEK